MRHIGLIDYRFDPKPLLAQLETHPEVWDEIPIRTSHPKSPHREVSDVWVRYNLIENFHGDMGAFNGPHESEWYPVAEKLPQVRTLAHELMQRLEGEKLGGILITKVPAGKQVYPHVDSGWHAGHYQKIGLQVIGNSSQSFCFEDGELSAQSGEAYFFDNHVPHWVRNNSAEDRITLIITGRWRLLCH